MKIVKTILIIVAIIGASLFGIYQLRQYQNLNSHTIFMKVLKNQWKFSPDVIKIPVNQTWNIHIYNEDSYDHGFFVSELGVNQVLRANSETMIKITPDKIGTYSFSCSVICGAGHYRMNGQLIVTP